jgi:hypothetical protein
MDVTSRPFHSVPHTRSAIYQKVLHAAANLPPVSNAKHRLQLTDVHYADSDQRTPAQHKRAILERGTLVRRLRGTWALSDTRGKGLERKTP